MKLLLALVFVFFNLAAFAFDTIVIPLDRVLVQGVPRFNVDNFPKTELIKYKNKYYRKNEKLLEFLDSLNGQGLKIAIVSVYDKDISDNILVNLKSSQGDLASSMVKLYSAENLKSNTIDVKTLKRDLGSDILLIDHSVSLYKNTRGVEVIDLGFQYFAYKDFSDAVVAYQEGVKRSLNAAIMAQIPTVEENWFIDNYKLAYLQLYFKEATKIDTASLKAFLSLGRSWQTNIALSILQGTFSETYFDYVSESYVVTGCFEFETRTRVKGKEVGLDKCAPGRKFEYAWEEKERSRCLSFTENKVAVEPVDQSLCSNLHALKDQNGYRFTTLFFRNGKLVEFIPEILNMSPGDTLKQSLLNTYDSVLVAISLMQNKHEDFEEDRDKGAYDYMKDSEVVIAFDQDLYPSIEKNCFLNQHQVNSSNGTLNQSRRNNAENSFLGITIERNYRANLVIDNPLHWVRPIYSYLFLTKPHGGAEYAPLSTQYGNVFAKMKDEVKHRSTFTLGDSLSIHSKNGAGAYKHVHTFHLSSKHMPNKQERRYNETQIWGKTCFEDVEYFMVNCGNGFEKVNNKYINAMKQAGIPVYSCQAYKNPSGDVSRVYRGTQL